jgi:hypothetical protein
MTKLESLQDIKDTAVRLLETLMGSDIESIKTAETAFQQLVDRFYKENEEMMAPRQYEIAKGDFEYFMRLLVLAMAYYQEDDGVIHG